jgi:hypothetical protein
MSTEMNAIISPYRGPMVRIAFTLQGKAFVVAPRNIGRIFKCEDMNVVASNGACPQEELDPTMASKKSKTTKKAKKGKR